MALTLLLTLAAYKLAVSTMIPQVSYQTALDHYVLTNFLLLAAVALAVGILPQLAQYPDADADAGVLDNTLVDTICFYVLFGAWCAIQLRYAVWAISLIHSRGGRHMHKDPALMRQASATDRWGEGSYRTL